MQQTFSEYSFTALLKSNLAKHGFVHPTPIQVAAIPPALEGRNVVATAQTGTGKTLAFVLPIIERLALSPAQSGIRVVVLAPTRELAIQTHETFDKLAAGSDIRTAICVGGLNEQKQLHAIRKGAQVLVATPGRMFDFVSRKLIHLRDVQILVLDEADRMLDMGFLPVIEKLMAAMPVTRQTLFFSATIESSVKHLVESHVRDAARVSVGSITKPIEKVELHVYEVEQDRKLGLLAYMLREQEGSFLVFARTRRGADRLAKKLSREGLKAAAIHGDRTQNQRNQALRGFQDRYYRVLVATDVAARGIHVEGIAHVVNYDLPQIPEDFIHRVGRTGRAGASGTASTFATRTEREEVVRIERTIKTKLLRREVSNDIPREQERPAPAIEKLSGPERRPLGSFAPRHRRARRPRL